MRFRRRVPILACCLPLNPLSSRPFTSLRPWTPTFVTKSRTTKKLTSHMVSNQGTSSRRTSTQEQNEGKNNSLQELRSDDIVTDLQQERDRAARDQTTFQSRVLSPTSRRHLRSLRKAARRKSLRATWSPIKEPHQELTVAQTVLHLEGFPHQGDVVLRSDGELALVDLVKKNRPEHGQQVGSHRLSKGERFHRTLCELRGKQVVSNQWWISKLLASKLVSERQC